MASIFNRVMYIDIRNKQCRILPFHNVGTTVGAGWEPRNMLGVMGNANVTYSLSDEINRIDKIDYVNQLDYSLFLDKSGNILHMFDTGLTMDYTYA